MKQLFRALRKLRYQYQPLVQVYIYAQNLLHNLQVYKELVGKPQIAAVLKSNAYGHGLVQVAKIFDKKNLPFLVVDSYFEALVLRNEKIKTPILIIGYSPLANIKKNRLKKVAYTIISLNELKDLAQVVTVPINIHLKIDTGMHRQGLLVNELDVAIELIKNCPKLNLEGICSHLADADSEQVDFTQKQIKLWNTIAAKFKQEFRDLKYFHLAATAGAAFSPHITANVVRVGLGLYGINSKSNVDLDLRPALELRSLISSIKTLKQNESIGYGLTFKAPKDLQIATIPVGYYEGLDRRLSNKGNIKFGNNYLPILGRISMNISSVDVTNIVQIKNGDPVIVISANKKDKNSVENLAKICQALPYEILVHIPQHLRRTIV